MRLWIKKLSVVLITFMTLGIYIPPTYLDASVDNSGEIITTKSGDHSQLANSLATEASLGTGTTTTIDYDSSESFISYLTEQAKEQTVTKFGPKISEQIEEEFITTIFPGMEEVITMLIAELDEDYPYYAITESPSSGYGEKIFHLYNYQTKTDVARFHVRRVNRPQEGYWFNFHYHLSQDGFEEHYDLGEIYWNKNTPPKWMS